ncbi:ABC transporter permease [Porphyromonas circumdentaria]|uniref:Lipoprotein-releasing system permease protein n=1 Tax=Porphyromonas circumdentaria TaxID=29524 RepID=A0A1T4P7B2_9PORP|nr:FtsX-like permease family protein [Porphyromonas circumdentaria]MBB6276287.1 lipoprotein-releasing system permease protein [Porphyromonas circumdentaria]SJZ87301.1 lipoprotein-releasing system permease protein [Porphyromonas circumdentaria]
MKNSRFAWFVARRLSRKREAKERSVTTLLRFTISGIALSLVVMLLTVFVGTGFRQEVRVKVTLLTGDLILSRHMGEATTPDFFQVSDAVFSSLRQVEGVRDVRRVIQTAGILKTKESYEGVIITAVNSGTSFKRAKDFLLSGNIPSFDGTDTLHNPILLPRETAQKLNLNVGDRVALYLTSKDITVRSFTLAGIVDIPQIGGSVVIAPIAPIGKALHLQEEELSRLQIFFNSYSHVTLSLEKIVELLSNRTEITQQSVGWNYAEETLPSIFVWLDMLDSNILLLLTLLSLVAAFTLITGLLILILDRTQMIGLLKALGATQHTFRSMFLYLATFIIGRGMLWGNLIAISIAIIQKETGIFSLDPSSYYLSKVPVSWNWTGFVVVNSGTFVLSMLFLLLPIRIIARIRSIETIRFNQ